VEATGRLDLGPGSDGRFDRRVTAAGVEKELWSNDLFPPRDEPFLERLSPRRVVLNGEIVE
jgi:hypothetical protein